MEAYEYRDVVKIAETLLREIQRQRLSPPDLDGNCKPSTESRVYGRCAAAISAMASMEFYQSGTINRDSERIKTLLAELESARKECDRVATMCEWQQNEIKRLIQEAQEVKGELAKYRQGVDVKSKRSRAR